MPDGMLQLGRDRRWTAVSLLCAVTVTLSVIGLARADASALSRARPAAVTVAAPLSSGPATKLPGTPVAIAQGQWTSGGAATLSVLGAAMIWEVRIAVSGEGEVTHATPLPSGADAVGIACRSVHPGLQGVGTESLQECDDATLRFVLDRASQAVLVYGPQQDGSLVERASVAVGSRPSAFLFANFNAGEGELGVGPGSDELTDIAVANEGSDDVSILMARNDGTYAPQQRITVGARPRDVAAGHFDDLDGNDLAVANAGSGSISFLGGDGHGGFARRTDVAVGGAPSTLLTDGPDGWFDLNGDGEQDLLAADATEGTVSVLLGRRDGLPQLASRVSLPGGPTSEPVALRLTERLPDEETHVLVAARGTGEVLDIPISNTGALGAPGSVLSGAQPVAVHPGSFTADLGEDAVVADGSGVLRLLVASASRVVEQRRGVANVAAGDGLVAWSQRVRSQRYRVRVADGSGVRYLPASASRQPLTPRLGRAADGSPVVTYRRCRADGCTPWIWNAARRQARRLSVPTARGCSTADFAMWNGTLAFMRASSSCPRGERGLWISKGARRFRISARASGLADLRGQRVSWFEGNEVLGRLRVSSFHGRPHTVVEWTADDGQGFQLGLLSGQFIYWLEPPDRGQERATLKRASVSTRCQALGPTESFDMAGGRLGQRPIAIDGRQLIWARDLSISAPGVFATEPEPTRWQPCR
ncbi:hypothetical protein [Solirubrobacter soli]|uniref:hypothetical protein n=1 Tax=Solirubrobacter soli TaxID=363832 RepID=UPI000428EA9D|nr:hypothetical protein [Solirubrobacter soli]